MATMNVRGQLQPAPHINLALKIQNISGLILPIGGGIKLQPGQTRVLNTAFTQIIEEMMPRLNRLVVAGKITYKLMPAMPSDTSPLHDFCFGASTTTGTQYLGAPGSAIIGGSADTGRIVVGRACTIQGMCAVCQTAPGGSDTSTLTVYKNGVATSLVLVLSGTNLGPIFLATPAPQGPQDLLDLVAGDQIGVKCVSTSTLTAGLAVSLQVG